MYEWTQVGDQFYLFKNYRIVAKFKVKRYKSDIAYTTHQIVRENTINFFGYDPNSVRFDYSDGF